MWGYVSTDKAAEVANANQFFDSVLERLAFVCSVVVVSVIAVVLDHVCIGGVGCFVRWWDEIGMEGFVEKSRSRTLRGAYLVKRGCRGSLGLESGRGGGLSGPVVEGL